MDNFFSESLVQQLERTAMAIALVPEFKESGEEKAEGCSRTEKNLCQQRRHLRNDNLYR